MNKESQRPAGEPQNQSQHRQSDGQSSNAPSQSAGRMSNQDSSSNTIEPRVAAGSSEVSGKERRERAAGEARIGDTQHGKRTANLTGVFKQVALSDNTQSIAKRPLNDPLQAPAGEEADAVTEMLSTLPKINSKDESNFTQMFHALEKQASVGTSSRDRIPGFAPSQESPREAKGEFTRVFQRVDEPQPLNENSLPLPPETNTAASRSGGVFTQLLRTLSDDKDVEMTSDAAITPERSTQQPEQGLGEFTRIMSRSVLRDTNSRPFEEGTQEHAVKAAAMPKTGVPNSPPPAHHSDNHAPVPQEKPTSTLQKYVPALLVANLFIMILVLVLVGIALLRR